MSQGEAFRVVVGIPVYNEEEAVKPLLDSLARVAERDRLDLTVVFVDDGSSDGTPELLRQASQADRRIRVLTHERNLGLGAAVQTILDYAESNLENGDVLITMDGDNTHDPEIIPAMVTLLKAKRLDLVVASRFTRGAEEQGLSPYRRLLSRGASLFFQVFFPIRGIRDYSSGFRAYNVGFLKRGMARCGRLVTVTGFECMAEILVKLRPLKPKAGEYPLVLRYDRKHGPSKMRILRTIRGYLGLLRRAA